MECPVCKQAHLEMTPLEDELTAHSCSQCGGHWIKTVRYLRWLEIHGENLPEKPPAEAVPLPVRDSKPCKLCADCGAFLIPHRVGHGVEFNLDRCGQCGGIWLDGNEWEVLKSRNLHDDIHLVFADSWQQQVTREQLDQGYREMATQILDDKLRQVADEATVTRLHEVKQWLDGHPQGKELYGYLASTKDL